MSYLTFFVPGANKAIISVRQVTCFYPSVRVSSGGKYAMLGFN